MSAKWASHDKKRLPFLVFIGLVKQLLLYTIFAGMPVVLWLSRGIIHYMLKINIGAFSGRYVSTKECINL